MGDPAFVQNVTALQAFYLEPSTAAEVRKNITVNTTHPAEWYDPDLYTPPQESGTSHLVTADESGMVVSLTRFLSFISAQNKQLICLSLAP